MRQKCILLRLIKPMDLVHEDNCPATQRLTLLRLIDGLAYLFHTT